jgi:phosphonatase-like hydrolase
VDLLEFTGADVAVIESTYRAFLELLDKAYATAKVIPQKGALATFNTLRAKHILIVLNTGYNHSTASLLLKKLGWEAGREYDLLVTADQVEQSRPHGDMIVLAQKKLGVPNSSAVAKVGDSIIDIEEGRNAGCGLVVGITTGAHTRGQLESAEPDVVVDALGELLALL